MYGDVSLCRCYDHAYALFWIKTKGHYSDPDYLFTIHILGDHQYDYINPLKLHGTIMVVVLHIK